MGDCDMEDVDTATICMWGRLHILKRNTDHL
jgi:hypothetical protein